ncbi:sensor histidine kinase [Phytomonospora endophytica]|uniref:histidine kinase n=1 Tax=Phytomonospora endophytica TaxID=714109 RepID=A0A841FPY0_9ACTN|nr:histidine kinase [Phytomonospora endophytica]MBB6034010.1 signal transduction histidine kinase [Phytomonospora endophytica]GIG64469.1 two-component sensor histidine kinase [Phytomonospora endophytica]
MDRKRGARDWIVDSAAFAFAVLFGLTLSGMRIDANALPEPAWLFDVDQVLGAIGCGAVWLRRRWPVQLAVGLVLASTISELVAGAMLIALFTVAVHRRPRVSMTVFGLAVLAGVVYVIVRPDPDTPREVSLLMGTSLMAAAVGWGLFVHHRRRLVESLRDRATRAENEAQMRAEQAQRDTRDAIAREIHDVLGHRLSLLSVHAGALEFRPDAPAEDVVRAAGVIRENAHLALQDLREVIGVLRAPVGELPQPAIADVERLVAESVRAGTPVELAFAVEGEPPDLAGRTAYRVVQEALTNARKHAPGEAVTVEVSGAPGRGLTAVVRNRFAGAVAAEGGQGLIGLAERVALAGGEVAYGPGDGEWLVRASLPWPP